MSETTPPLLALRDETLPELAERGLRLDYDRNKLVPKIAHIGVGGFHRAHLAVYLQQLARAGDTWAVRGIGLLPNDQAMADALGPQDHLYTLTIKATETKEAQLVGSIIDYVLAADDTAAAVDALADAEIKIVSMTVTEAGYTDEPINQRTFDVIAAGLARRHQNDAGPVTVMSCDNLPGNGDAARRCTLAAIDRLAPELHDWVEEACTFPNSMVDRITPQTSEADRAYLVDRYGIDDRWPVVAEPFCQWVLEDDFAAGRPDFASVGVLYTDDVHAWELYKLRMLNAGHSCIAYLSALADIELVDEALATPAVARYLETFLYDEAAPPLTEIPGHPAADYARAVIERFANAGVSDQIARLCADGTAKFPTFLMPTIEAQLAQGGPIAASALALAGWAHYLSDIPVAQQAPDALGHLSRPLADAARSTPEKFLENNPAFIDTVATDPRFIEAFVGAHQAITAGGPLAAIDQIVARTDL